MIMVMTGSENNEYIMTEDGLKPTHPQKSDDDENNNDDQQNDQQPADTSHTDSSHYHYQPSNTKPDTPVKNVKVVDAAERVSTIKISDITSSFLERLSL